MRGHDTGHPRRPPPFRPCPEPFVQRLSFLIALMVLLPAAASAQEQRAPVAESRLPSRAPSFAPPLGQGMPDAVRRVERQTGGQVLNVESMRFQGREIHRVKVLQPGGRIRIVVDDPAKRGTVGDEPAFRSTRGNDGRKP